MIDIQEFLGRFSVVSYLLYILQVLTKIICMAISHRSPQPPPPQNSSTFIGDVLKKQESGCDIEDRQDVVLDSSEFVSDGNAYNDEEVKARDTMIRFRKRPSRLFVPELYPCNMGYAHEMQMKMERKEFVLQETNYCLVTKKGKREVMEDAHGVLLDVFEDPKQAFFVVIDGHGGRAAADFVAEHLGKNIVDAAGGEKEEMFEAAIQEGHLATDKGFLSQGLSGGACATSAFFRNGHLHVANLGDCRAVLSRNGIAHVLTSDHRLTREDERLRVESSGGYVHCRNGVWRVNGSLAVSRAIGDLHLKPYVISQPEIHRFPLTSKCKFLIMASDGLWDKVSDQEAVDVITRGKSLVEGCKELVDMSCSRGNIDDISVMVINVQPYAKSSFQQ